MQEIRTDRSVVKEMHSQLLHVCACVTMAADIYQNPVYFWLCVSLIVDFIKVNGVKWFLKV